MVNFFFFPKYFLKFILFFFLGETLVKFFNIHSFIHTIFFHVLLGCVSVGRCAFFVFGYKHSGCKLFLEDSGGPQKGQVWCDLCWLIC